VIFIVDNDILLICTAIAAMNASYHRCLLRCRCLANAEGLHTNRLMPDVSQSIADQLLYTSAIEMVWLLFTSKTMIHSVTHRVFAL